MDATAAGRTPNSGRSSRFRTGRLESAQMIIPTLLAQQVRTDPSADSDDEDGLTAEERANIARTLAQLAGEQYAGGPSDLSGQQVLRPAAAAPSISQMLGAEPSVDPGMVRAKAPPAVRPTAVPIAVPANRALDKEEVQEPTEPVPTAAPAKKMSRCVVFCWLLRDVLTVARFAGSRRGSWVSSRPFALSQLHETPPIS